MSERVTGLGPGSEVTDEIKQRVLPVAFDDLVAWYPFREGTGEDITAGDSRFGDTTDYSAVVNGATYKPNGGTTDIQTGANSGAFDFDGTDDTLDLGTVADSDQSLTFMTWIKPDTVSKGTQRFFTKAPAGTKTDGQLMLRADVSGGTPVLLITNNGTNLIIKDSSTSLTANSYSHLVGRYDFQSGTGTLFTDGQPVASKSVGRLPALSSQPWLLGEQEPSTGSNFLDGSGDDTRIYTGALSDSQINQIYLNTKP